MSNSKLYVLVSEIVAPEEKQHSERAVRLCVATAVFFSWFGAIGMLLVAPLVRRPDVFFMGAGCLSAAVVWVALDGWRDLMSIRRDRYKACVLREDSVSS